MASESAPPKRRRRRPRRRRAASRLEPSPSSRPEDLPVYMHRARALLATTTMSGVLTYFWWRLGMEPVLAWLLAITLMTFLAYAYDKWAACVGRGRVAEQDLLILALMGGTVGAAVAMQLARHKTSKLPFRRQFGLVMCLQALFVALWFFRHHLWPNLGF